MKKPVIFHIESLPHMACYTLNAAEHESDKVYVYHTPCKISYDVGTAISATHAPLLTLDRGDLQNLFDELWRVGCRPSAMSKPVRDAALAATERHLNDMRQLTVSLLAKSGVSVDLDLERALNAASDSESGSF